MRTRRRPRLTPAIADIRRAVREHLPSEGRVLVALSGGADSLALAAATAFEAPRAGIGAGAIIVDHALQNDSATVAEKAADQARNLGLDPVIVDRISVSDGDRSRWGLEAAARGERRAAFERAVDATQAQCVFLGHTLDDQAETVLLGLARGSGAQSLSGMRSQKGIYVRPLLTIRRAETRQFCSDSGLTYWDDPHNDDPAFTRVRVRTTVIPLLENELSPGVSRALARTADLLQEDADYLDALGADHARRLCQREDDHVRMPARELAELPCALQRRVVRHVVAREFGVSLSNERTRAVTDLITRWRGQKPLNLPGVRVARCGSVIEFRSAEP